MQWTLEGEQIRCLRHAIVFDRTRICERCVMDPPPSEEDDEDAPIVPAPAGCLSTVGIESRLTALADFAEEQARLTLNELEAGWHRFGAGTKLLDTAIKALRSAGQYATTREAEVVVRRRMRELAKLAAKVRH